MTTFLETRRIGEARAAMGVGLATGGTSAYARGAGAGKSAPISPSCLAFNSGVGYEQEDTWSSSRKAEGEHEGCYTDGRCALAGVSHDGSEGHGGGERGNAHRRRARGLQGCRRALETKKDKGLTAHLRAPRHGGGS